MKIVHVASELFPFMKTGGLADAAAGLSRALAQAGHDVAFFLPGYRAALEQAAAANAERVLRLQVELGEQFLSADIWRAQIAPRLTVYFVVRDEFFDRRFAYGTSERDYDDNAERFIFFDKAVVEALRLLDLKADVVHAHDWQTALLPIYLRLAERQHGTLLAAKTAFTVHNLAFQGIFPMGTFALTNLPEEFRGVDGLEFYGQANMLKAGLLFADRVTTVSPTYAKEIQTPQFGCGLEGVIATRAADLVGLLNGIDDAVWNPATDPLLPARYTTDDLSGKFECRQALLRKVGFDPEFKGPVYGIIARLTEQKGIDLLLANRKFFEREHCRLVVVGSGLNHYEEALAALAAGSPRRIALARVLDEPMAHLVEAGADFFLMPSVFEPCGLNQMYSQRYGTIPLCSRVGGLVDTVVDLDENPEAGTGLLFSPNASGLDWALQRSLVLHNDRAACAAIQRRGMARDFGWAAAAQRYEMLYRDAL
jgi:starch synthase